MKKMFADYHVHTEFSDDSVYEMEEVVKDAIQIKMEEICFTDHVDYGVKLDWNDKKEIQYRDGMLWQMCIIQNILRRLRNYNIYMVT